MEFVIEKWISFNVVSIYTCLIFFEKIVDCKWTNNNFYDNDNYKYTLLLIIIIFQLLPMTAKLVNVIIHTTHKRWTGVKGCASGTVAIDNHWCSSIKLLQNILKKVYSLVLKVVQQVTFSFVFWSRAASRSCNEASNKNMPRFTSMGTSVPSKSSGPKKCIKKATQEQCSWKVERS